MCCENRRINSRWASSILRIQWQTIFLVEKEKVGRNFCPGNACGQVVGKGDFSLSKRERVLWNPATFLTFLNFTLKPPEAKVIKKMTKPNLDI